MTADRAERKYLIQLDQAARLTRCFDQHLTRHVHGDTKLPGARLYSTTIYFDTSSRHLYTEASRADESVKLRAREYHAVDPSMVQLAKSPEELVRFDPILWFELKHKRGGHVRKRRFAIPKPEVPAFLCNGSITQEMLDLHAPHYGERAQAALTEISELCQHYSEPFRVDCIVNYRRIAWQADDGLTRLTLDRDVRFYAAPADLWTRSTALTAETLGRPKARLDQAIVEVKSRGALPDWLAGTLQDAGADASNFSKFVTASQSIREAA